LSIGSTTNPLKSIVRFSIVRETWIGVKVIVGAEHTND
jgi:hypothetical protein